MHGISPRWVTDNPVFWARAFAEQLVFAPDPCAYRTFVWVKLADDSFVRLNDHAAHSLLALLTSLGIDVIALSNEEAPAPAFAETSAPVTKGV